MMGRTVLALLVAAATLLPGCGSRAVQYENSAGTVADLRAIPQELSRFADRYGQDGTREGSVAGVVSGSETGPDVLLRSHADARADMREFRRHFFGPWAAKAIDQTFVLAAVEELDRDPEQRGFAENLHPWSEASWQLMRENADVPGLEARRFNRPRAAITVRVTDLRAAPTMKPRFSQVHGAGKGWPFDLFQQSALPVGLPLAVVHQSRDGAWLFVESSVSWGWVRAEDVAFTGPSFRAAWLKSRLAAFVREGVGRSARRECRQRAFRR